MGRQRVAAIAGVKADAVKPDLKPEYYSKGENRWTRQHDRVLHDHRRRSFILATVRGGRESESELPALAHATSEQQRDGRIHEDDIVCIRNLREQSRPG